MNLELNQNKNFNKLSSAFLMISASFICYISIFFTLFSAFPLALALTIFGRIKGYSIIFATWIIAYLISFFVYKDVTFFIGFIPVIIIGSCLGELILRKMEPSEGLLKYGFVLTMIIISFLTFLYFQHFAEIKSLILSQIDLMIKSVETHKAVLMQENSEDSFNFLATLNNKEKLLETILTTIPRTLIVGIFVGLWANLLIILRLKKFFFSRITYMYSERELLNFPLPDFFIWPLIVSIGLTIYGMDAGNKAAHFFGESLIWTFAVLYFFQGIGLFFDLLTHFKFFGFFRLVFVLVFFSTVPYWYIVLSILGIVNSLLDIRNKIFQNKSNSNSIKGE